MVPPFVAILLPILGDLCGIIDGVDSDCTLKGHLWICDDQSIRRRDLAELEDVVAEILVAPNGRWPWIDGVDPEVFRRENAITVVNV